MTKSTLTISGLLVFALPLSMIYAEGLGDPFKSRYAYSCDGFNQDRDDIAASAMTLALFDRAGLSHKLVHFHFNTNFGGKPTHAGEHRKSALQSAVLFGIIQSEDADDGFFDVASSPAERLKAVAHLAEQIKISTENDPLVLICAGGVQTNYLAVQKAIDNGAGPEALKTLTFLSHSPANEKTRTKNHENKDYHPNWDNLKELTPTSRFIDATSPIVNGKRTGGVNASQDNTDFCQSPRKRCPGVEAWKWLAAYGDRVEGFGFAGTKGEWLLERLKAAGAPALGHNGNAEGDASDAGMIFGAVLGNPTDATMEDIRNFFMGRNKWLAMPVHVLVDSPNQHTDYCGTKTTRLDP